MRPQVKRRYRGRSSLPERSRNELLRTPSWRNSRRMIYGQILGSVKLHSWVTTLGQQGTEVQDGGSSTLGGRSPPTPYGPTPCSHQQTSLGPPYCPAKNSGQPFHREHCARGSRLAKAA